MSHPSEDHNLQATDPAASNAEIPQQWLGSEPEKASARASASGSTRRAFLFKLAVGVNALVGLVLAVPILGFLLGPALRKEDADNSWVKLGGVGDFPLGETRLAEYINPVTGPTDGETAKTACWVRHADDGSFQVFAINCAHLGCPVRWFAQSRLFLCPCHGGAYYEDGARASGPPERGLFQYKHRVAGNSLMIFAGQLPTLSNEACGGNKPLVQLTAQANDTGRSA